MDGDVTWKIRRLSSPGPFCSATACPACLFTNQSITPCFPIVINQAFPASFPSAPHLLADEGKKEEQWNINQREEKWQWWNGPGGMMPLLSSKWTIAPEPVNRYPGSTQGSRWMFGQALSSEGDRRSLWWYGRPYQTNPWLSNWEDKRMYGILCLFSEQTGCYLLLKKSFKTSEMTRQDI